VTIRPDGTVEKVQVVRESSAGFGRAAATFARSQKFEPALDDDGNPIGATKDFAVSYDR
jgi:outer membrane biosynthesis protein TonB